MSWSLSGQSPNDSDIEWQCVDICGYKIINVYKAPPSQMTPTSVQMFSYSCLYARDFNFQYKNWCYTNTNENGSILATWAAGGNLLYDPKGPASFLLGRWELKTNPDLAFASFSDDDLLPCRRVLEKLPRFQHRPSLITSTKLANPIPSKPANRWNFHKGDWKQYGRITDQLSSDLPSPDTTKLDEDTRSFAELCFLRPKKPSHVDVDATTPHAGINYVKVCTKTSLPLLMDQSPEGLLRLCCKNLTKRDAGDGTRLSNPLTLPTLVVEHGPLLTTLLVTPDTHLASVLFLQMPSLPN